jgi:N-acetylglucosaminyl-diphospho-decaprenol L-rhamnosyltransferase
MATVTPAVSAIVVSHNSAAVLAGCIEALQAQLCPDELLVVDNASHDGSPTIARALGAKVIVNPSNPGFGAGCNRGARSAENELVMFVNPDVRVLTVDAQALGEQLAHRPLGLLAPRALIGVDGQHPESSLRRSLPWPCNVAREALGPVLPRELAQRMSAAIDSPGNRSWLSAAALLCARTEFLRLGGFDERLFLYYEDQELSRRYRASGLPLSVTDAITARHVRGGSSGEDGELRPIPRAASVLSSVEVVGISKGPRDLRAAWMLMKALRRGAEVSVTLMARRRSRVRARRKLYELRSTEDAVVQLLGESGPSYPQVKSLT